MQREYLRTIVVPCYPNFSQVEFELVAKGMHKPWAYMAARQGLEGVLYVMNNTVVWEVIEDLDRRLAFLFNLQEMLQPFRKLKAGDTLDLNKAFEFSATGSGGRTKEQLDLTLLDWGEPCFDLHLLQMAGVKITPAKTRVAAVHRKTPESLEKAYKDWSQHPVRKEVSRRGDDHAREILNLSNIQVLLGTAFPAPLATPRPHRPA